ncbi:Putative G protein-coupled receptor GPR1 [Septoria linicola]|uniref:G protein-coupled receptor GPR1 n=1 Tax=Septoria linicola TaxID=215465 RepID=A0A9Q9AXA3_9PEZI|nr:putative G protein-coupled receptor GPR1 [Septoria linicola]USW57124.1 Putative G protein-coupled receptor GPR1 [Septoria linicola]
MASNDVLADALQGRGIGLAPTSTSPLLRPASAFPAAIYDQLSLSLQTRSASLGYNPDFNASALLAKRQQNQLQIIASTFSSVSILAAICAIYWFCMMRRNFRRDLVLLLIIGDFWKSTWFLVFSTTTLAKGHIYTSSNFCQATGYFLQLGLEACDCAIFLMSLHMMLQIFPPKNSFLGADGLYRIRYWVLAGWLVVPNAMTSIAFSNTGPAFVSQGGFCSLPIRPIWFRLALSWIPRYLIWIFVMGVAIRIYRHVGYEFKVFGQENDQTSSAGIPDHSPGATSNAPTTKSSAMQRQMSSQSDAATVEKQAISENDIAPDDDSMLAPMSHRALNDLSVLPRTADFGRRQSVPNWVSPFGTTIADVSNLPLPGPIPLTSRSMPSSRRGSRQVSIGNGVGAEDFAAAPIELTKPRGSVSTMASRQSGGEQSAQEAPSPALAPINEHRTNTAATSAAGNVAKRAMQSRRKAIQRQLRLLFIYPVVYLLLWIFPFISHSLNYSNYYAQHPIFALSVLNIFCQNIMGFCDVCIFCWREKPWRHIPGSDGTFFGSFLFWKYCFSRQWIDEQRRKSSAFPSLNQEKATEETSQSGLIGSIKRWSMSITGQTSTHRPSNASMLGTQSTPPRVKPRMHRRTRSGGSDRRVLQAEQAHERLARERADYEQHRRSLQDRRTSAVSAHQQQQQATQPERKEWWDRHMSISDDLDDDDGTERVR